MKLKNLWLASGSAIVLMGSILSSNALNFSFQGNFVNDNDVQLFTFSVGAPSSVTLRSWSYAGGVNANGDVIARGGFDTILALFDSAGNLINQNDDGGPSFVPADSVSGAYFDTYLTSLLGAGTYTVSVMQYNNFAIGPNLANGFIHGGAGQETFTGTLTGHPGERFWDVANTHRDSHWAFDVLNVQNAVASVPDAGSSWVLLGLGVSALAMFRRRK